MDAGLVKVRIAGPAKLGGRWLKAGDEPEVTAEELAALTAAGLIEASTPDIGEGAEGYFPDGRKMTVAEWEAAVQAAALQLAGQAFDGELGRLEREVKEIVASADTEKAELKAQIAHLEGVVADLEGQLTHAQGNKSSATAGDAGAADFSNSTSPPGGAAVPAASDTPPSEKVAKTAPKKGAATTTKG